MANIHFAINNSALVPNSKLLDNILNGTHTLPILRDKKGFLFSYSVLEKLMENEAKHNTKTLTNKQNRSIRSLSNGEQKKALLNYAMLQKPAFLILDSPFESLDAASVISLRKKLVQLSSKIIFVQIFNRKEEILPVITHILEIKNDKITAQTPIENYHFKTQNFVFNGKIPKSITTYKNIKEPLIAFKNVNVFYDENQILNNINWTIYKNEFWQLIGPNGSGKSTILSMIYGNNVKAYEQDVYLFGKKKGTGESVWEIKRKIGYFSPNILELFHRKQTVKQMILSGFYDSVGLYKTPSTLQNTSANEWINLLNLNSDKNTAVQNLPVAKQRLVLIARAIIKHPPLLILDEPLINLDEKGTALVVALINKIAKESNTTVLFVSHRVVKDIQPDFTYKLSPTKHGSVGNVLPFIV
ncbi:ATP-binding cassette domain-containing protein [Polaribacter batillariae]|uniref:ATP-binding cassette domain-containing protein n=1 Tax=Polaribacter batillariae TaxID=2808900 RepID=A0ABX7SZN1_9FLAO|nr:ATP-binding cassette domain-containing protein [Polaribacter batillariae]QTD38249.1 ATP-binding cassette domain-containing protein [Polaribacter batillariae]